MAVVEVAETIETQARQARVDLAAAFQIAARLGLNEGVDNHFTMRVPGATDRFLINPRDMHWSEIRASDVLVVDADGRVVEGRRMPPRSGTSIHIPIHQAHPRGRCVFHTHMPYATALAALRGGRLEMVHQNSARFHDDVAYDDEFNGIAVDPAEGRRMARAFGDKTVLFLANHGVIVATDTVAEAIDGLYYLERAAQVQVLAMSTGRALQVMAPELAQRTRSQFGNIPAYALRHFEAQKRLLDRDGSDYAT
jgi:ribulose-5-phosphate 4-epimerase/fuculose-1-phosphate aldolase